MTFPRKLLLGVILFALFVLLPVALFMLPVWDGPPPDDADLTIPVRRIPDEENAYPLILEAHAVMRFPDHQQRREWSDDPAAHQEDIQRSIEENRHAFALLAEAISLGDLQSDLKPEALGIPSLTEFLELANALRLYAATAPRAEDRVEFLSTLIEFALLFRETEGPLITELVRIAIESMAFLTLPELARDPEIPSGDLREILRRMESARPDVLRQTRTKQLEYQFFVHSLENWQEADLSLLIEDDLSLDFMFSTGFMWQPNNTLRLFHRIYSEQIDSLNSGSPHPVSPTLDQLAYEMDAHRPWTPKGAFNRVGKLIAKSVLIDANIDKQFSRVQANHAATLLVCALNLWHREHGELPERLEDLAPAYLTKIPADPWDGNPMRYNRDLARVYALGDNHTDHGGSARSSERRPRRENAEDFVFGVLAEIDFQAENP